MTLFYHYPKIRIENRSNSLLHDINKVLKNENKCSILAWEQARLFWKGVLTGRVLSSTNFFRKVRRLIVFVTAKTLSKLARGSEEKKT